MLPVTLKDTLMTDLELTLGAVAHDARQQQFISRITNTYRRSTWKEIYDDLTYDALTVIASAMKQICGWRNGTRCCIAPEDKSAVNTSIRKVDAISTIAIV
jgi:hypothetical protein